MDHSELIVGIDAIIARIAIGLLVGRRLEVSRKFDRSFRLIPTKVNSVTVGDTIELISENDAVVVPVAATSNALGEVIANTLAVDVELDWCLLQVVRSVGMKRRRILYRDNVTITQMHMEIVSLSGHSLCDTFLTTRVGVEARISLKVRVEDITPLAFTKVKVGGVLAEIVRED